MWVYPRLDTSSALGLLSEYSHLTISELKERSSVEHLRSQWYPTAPSRASQDRLSRVQSITRQVAEAHGYPEPQPERSPRFTPFDQMAGPQLYNAMDIVPADAASEGVWSFLSLVILPDVAFGVSRTGSSARNTTEFWDDRATCSVGSGGAAMRSVSIRVVRPPPFWKTSGRDHGASNAWWRSPGRIGHSSRSPNASKTQPDGAAARIRCVTQTSESDGSLL